ncbi:hypothetical protein [Pendulispora albinea]|uniref:Uncharacterized protein n=1 Tax=Pendulispora albinea TaxID=2741071 RepID=A0ABZ2MAD6_9BACT
MCAWVGVWATLANARARSERLALEALGRSPQKNAAGPVAVGIALSLLGGAVLMGCPRIDLQGYFPPVPRTGDFVFDGVDFVDRAHGLRVTKTGASVPLTRTVENDVRDAKDEKDVKAEAAGDRAGANRTTRATSADAGANGTDRATGSHTGGSGSGEAAEDTGTSGLRATGSHPGSSGFGEARKDTGTPGLPATGSHPGDSDSGEAAEDTGTSGPRATRSHTGSSSSGETAKDTGTSGPGARAVAALITALAGSALTLLAACMRGPHAKVRVHVAVAAMLAVLPTIVLLHLAAASASRSSRELALVFATVPALLLFAHALVKYRNDPGESERP